MIARITAFVTQFDRNLWILAAGWFVAALGFAASMPFVAIYFHEVLGLTTLQIGIFFGVQAVVRAVFQAIGGEVSDRIGRLPILIHSQSLRAAALFGLALAIDRDLGFWWVAGLLTLNSMVGSTFFPVVNAMVSDILPAGKRLDGYAVSRAAGNLGWGAGPALGGFLAMHSYAILFHISAAITLLSALVFWLFLRAPSIKAREDRFRLTDLAAVRHDKNLARHMMFCFVIYLVHAQLLVPFSIYTVEIAGISKAEYGWLNTVNGILVAVAQIPVTRLLAPFRFTTQIAVAGLIYFVGYGSLGFFGSFWPFLGVIIMVTTAEMFMSPPTLTLVSRLAPEGQMGRYMGIHGFFVTAGWSLGPLWGGFFLDAFSGSTVLAWVMIASLALAGCVSYFWFGLSLPRKLNLSD
ncbi:MAG: MFS transporter [Candidatus Zixiibacteriota bacterium]|nr:MAG: MFS transporter [candidate division Zixibacteria bacterium]